MTLKLTAVVFLFLFCRKSALSKSFLLQNGDVVHQHEFQGVSSWKFIPYLWVDKSVNITCAFTKDFKVYQAPSLEALKVKSLERQSVWCGWHNFLGAHSCVARISPFGPIHVGITHEGYAATPCSVSVEEHVSLYMLAQTVAGALLFLKASQLSESVFFRLGTGSAGVALLSVVILLFILSRMLPSKKAAAAMFAVFGSSFSGLVRYVFGQWIPSFEQLVRNPVFLSYLAVSAFVGLAITYYFDREDNVKLHNILKYGLKLVGLLLLAFSTSMPEASVSLCCLLLLAQLRKPAMFLCPELCFLSRRSRKTESFDFRHKGEVNVKTLSELVAESPRVFKRSREVAMQLPSHSGFRPQKTEVSSGEDEYLKTPKDDSIPEADSDSQTPSSYNTGGLDRWQARNSVDREKEGARESLESQGDDSPRSRYFPGAHDKDSPWLKRGLALNLETGRTVKMGGSTWGKLLQQGYQLDRDQGTLTPPAKLKSTPGSRMKTRRSP